jgi:soluble cytochrome b562
MAQSANQHELEQAEKAAALKAAADAEKARQKITPQKQVSKQATSKAIKKCDYRTSLDELAKRCSHNHERVIFIKGELRKLKKQYNLY